MRFFISSILMFFCFISSYAQKTKTLSLSFLPLYNNSALRLDNSYYKINENDSLQLDVLKFYVSGIELLRENKSVWKEKNSYHLLDASEVKSLLILLNVPGEISFDQVKINIGIDSIINVYGVMPGDLDPTKGMYWTWQSGYINLKLEGRSNICHTRNNEFQFHLGGYQFPDNSLQKIILNTSAKDKISVAIDTEKLISAVNLSKQDHIMSPGKEAMLISEKLPGIFSIQK